MDFIFAAHVFYDIMHNERTVFTIMKNKTSDKISIQTIFYKAGNIITALYFIALMTILPLYNTGSYSQIGIQKYEFFRNIGISITTAMILITGELLFLKRKLPKNLSVPDLFMYSYFISVIISYILSPFKEKAFWGADGWYMGLISQLLFIGIYFVFSRYFIWNDRWIYLIYISSGLVFLLGILDRYSVYLIHMEGQTPGFISTIGNINWFCGYWAVICPFGIVFYWISNMKWQQMAAGIYVTICFIAGIVQGSSSAYLIFAGIFIFLFSLSFQENSKMDKFLKLCILFTASCQIAKLLHYLPGFEINYENELSSLLTDTNLTLYAGMMFTVIYLLFYHQTKKNYDIKQHKKVRNVILILIIVISVIYTILLTANTCMENGIFGLSGISFFTFNDKWASSRGATWRIGIETYKNMPVQNKLTGIGPDCFACYAYSIDKLANDMHVLFGNAILTNAHNEWITILVNQGIAGLICFAGIFISAFVKFIKKAQFNPVLYLCATGILLYTLHNMVSFEQVMNVPFAFMILGIGESICRSQIKNRP